MGNEDNFNPKYRNFIDRTKNGNPYFNDFVESLARKMQEYDNINPYERNPLKNLIEEADSFLRRYTKEGYQEFIKQLHPDKLTGEDFGDLPEKRNLKKRLFEHRARLYLSALDDYERRGGNIEEVLPEIEKTKIPCLKRSRDEPTFQRILIALNKKT